MTVVRVIVLAADKSDVSKGLSTARSNGERTTARLPTKHLNVVTVRERLLDHRQRHASDSAVHRSLRVRDQQGTPSIGPGRVLPDHRGPVTGGVVRVLNGTGDLVLPSGASENPGVVRGVVVHGRVTGLGNAG